MIDNLFGIHIDENVLKLYNALHLVKGSFDDIEYATTVCNYYNNLLQQILDKTGIFSISEVVVQYRLTSIGHIEKAFDNVQLLVTLYEEIKASLNSNVDLTKYNVKMPSRLVVDSNDMTIWINQALTKLRALPKKRNYASDYFVKSPLRIFLDRDSASFVVPNNMYLEFVNHCKTPDESRITYPPSYSNYLISIESIERNKPSGTPSPTPDEIIIAENIAKKIVKGRGKYIVNIDEILDEIFKTITKGRKEALDSIRAEQRKKRLVFYFHATIWAMILTTTILLFVLLKPDYFSILPIWKQSRGNWGINTGIVLFIIVILGGVSLFNVYFAMVGDMFGFFFDLRMINCVPRGLPSFIVAYFAFIYDDTLVPYNYGGAFHWLAVFFLVFTIVLELYDLYGKCDPTEAICETVFVCSISEGRYHKIFYSNILSLMCPIGLLMLGWSSSFLNGSAYWAVSVFTIIFAIINSIGFVLGARFAYDI